MIALRPSGKKNGSQIVVACYEKGPVVRTDSCSRYFSVAVDKNESSYRFDKVHNTGGKIRGEDCRYGELNAD